MLVDLLDYRPKNESYEHYLLKQIGRAFLFQNQCRFVGCEVPINGNDQSPFGAKRVSDVVGLSYKCTPDNEARKVFNKIRDTAVLLGIGSPAVQSNRLNQHHFVMVHTLQGHEKIAMNTMIETFMERASVQHGYHKDIYKKLQNPYKEQFVCRSVESKVSLADFHNGFSMTAEFSYIIAPKGIVPKHELPSKVGLLEFDFDKFEFNRRWQDALTVSKKPKKQFDSKFLVNNKKECFNEEKHSDFCKDLMYKIAQQNTEETVNWNVLLREINEGYTGEFWGIHTFKYKAGDETPKGIVVERRIGKNPKYNKENSSLGRQREIEFYKLVVPQHGLTKWIPVYEL